MTQHVSGRALIESVAEQRSGHHDTLYVTQQQKNILEEAVCQQIELESVRSISVAGLRVEALPENSAITRPIACQKGDVFPLAQDWKNKD